MKHRSPDKARKGMRMKDLADATGLPKSTILHYISRGLLPEPQRTGRNTALYDPACVERAKFIKAIQTTYSFPLDKIRKLLLSRDEGKDVTSLIELHATVFGSSPSTALDEGAFRDATGLTPIQVSELLSLGLLMPLEKGSFTQEDVEAGRAYAEAFRFGMTASDLAFYVTIARELVDHEMRLRERLTGHLTDEMDAQVTTHLTMGARILRSYVANRVFQHRAAGMKTLKNE